MGAVEFFFALVEAIPLIIPQLIVALGQIIVTIVTNLIERIPVIFTEAWDFIVDLFSNIGGHFKNWFGNAATGIKEAFSGIGDFFSNIWTGIKNAFGNVGDWFKNVFSNAWQKVKMYSLLVARYLTELKMVF
jgi:phage-related protein